MTGSCWKSHNQLIVHAEMFTCDKCKLPVCTSLSTHSLGAEQLAYHFDQDLFFHPQQRVWYFSFGLPMFGISNHLSHRPEFVDTVQCIGKLGLWRTNLCKMVIVIA